MSNIVNIIQIVDAIALVAAVLLQHRGTALGGAFGGEGNIYRSRRGIEKFLYNSTLILGALFVLLAIWHLFL